MPVIYVPRVLGGVILYVPPPPPSPLPTVLVTANFRNGEKTTTFRDGSEHVALFRSGIVMETSR